MKVIICTRDLQYGIGTHIKQFLREAIDSSEIEKILLVGPHTTLDYDSPKIEFRSIPLFGKYFITKQPDYAIRTRNMIKENLQKEDYDLIHVHFPFLAKDFNIPLVSTFHFLNYLQSEVKYSPGMKSNIVGFAHRIFEIFDKSTMKYSSKSIFVSRSTMEKACKQYMEYCNKFIHIPNFVDTNCFFSLNKFEKLDLLTRYGLDPNYRYVLYVGRLEPMKGISELIKILNQMSVNGVRLLVVGDGPLSRDITNYEFVTHLGKVPYYKMNEIYNLSNIFILPSFSENSPLTVLEAMSCGLPVLSSDVGDVREILRDDMALFPPGNFESLRDRLYYFLKMSEEEVKEVGDRNRKIIVNNYSTNNALQIMELYENLLGVRDNELL